MDFHHLRTFVIVADAGGFARASCRLNLTQPAASRQILALEAELGVALFDRIGRRIQLTAEGEDLCGAVADSWKTRHRLGNERTRSKLAIPERCAWALPRK